MKNVGKGDAGKSDGAGAPKLFWRGEASKSYDLKKGSVPFPPPFFSLASHGKLFKSIKSDTILVVALLWIYDII
jgi:hypothetical protein